MPRLFHLAVDLTAASPSRIPLPRRGNK
jgi:hypothetical protein